MHYCNQSLDPIYRDSAKLKYLNAHDLYLYICVFFLAVRYVCSSDNFHHNNKNNSHAAIINLLKSLNINMAFKWYHMSSLQVKINSHFLK